MVLSTSVVTLCELSYQNHNPSEYTPNPIITSHPHICHHITSSSSPSHHTPSTMFPPTPLFTTSLGASHNRPLPHTLHGLPQVIPSPLLLDDVLVDAAGGEVVVSVEGDVQEALVVPKVQVNLPTIVQHKHLTCDTRTDRRTHRQCEYTERMTHHECYSVCWS